MDCPSLKFAASLALLALAGAPLHAAPEPKGGAEPYDSSYPYFATRIPLRTSPDEVAVKLRSKGDLTQKSTLAQARSALPSTLVDASSMRALGGGIVVARSTSGMTRAALRSRLSTLVEVEWVAPVYTPPSGNDWVATEEVLVRLLPEDASRATLPFAKDKRILSYRLLPGTEDIYLLTLPAASAGEAALALSHELANSGRYTWAAPNAVQSWMRHATTNDPLLARQWHLQNNGGSSGGNPGQNGLAGADAKVRAAWDLVPGGDPSVVVAVIDDGPELAHPDLAPNLWTNPGEIASNGVDDDANGFIDDVRGWDFSAGLPGDNDAGHSTTGDEHATSVAGVIAARGNNAVGGAGAAYNVRWFSARVFAGGTPASDASFAAAINYASGRKTGGSWSAAHLTNNSWGGGSPSAPITDAFSWGATNGRGGLGILHLIAAGNGGTAAPNYPASLAATLPNVMCIGASTDRDARSSYSQYGTGLDLVAPSNGGTYSIVTTDRIGSLGYDPGDYAGLSGEATGFGGTSSATPLTTGVAALLLSHQPNLSAIDLRRALRYATDRIGGAGATYSQTYPPAFPLAPMPGTDTEYGFGRLNAFKALQGVDAPRARLYSGSTQLAPNASLPLSAYTGDEQLLSLVVRNESIHTLSISNVVVSPGPISLASTSEPQQSTHAPGALKTITLRFKPQIVGSGTQTLTFLTNDPDTPSYSISLNWTGLPLSIRGRVVVDFNGDGSANTFEPGNAGRIVFIDSNQDGLLASSSPKVSVDVPKSIPDSNTTGVDSAITITAPEAVYGMRVRFSITHPYTSDLDISLVSPTGLVIPLVNNRGGAGDNFTNTEIRDDATTAISAAAAPFSGSFTPEAPLSVLNGTSSLGTWRLRVRDRFAQDVGTLTAFSLEYITELSEITDADGVFRFRNLANGTYRIVAQTSPLWLRTAPSNPSYQSITVSAASSNLGVDFLESRMASVYGRVFHDSDGSQTAEAHEGGVPEVVVFNDANSNSILDGVANQAYPSTDTPKALPDQATVDSVLSIPSTFSISSVRVAIHSLTHTWMGDLHLTLIHPDGTQVRLITNRGAEASGYAETILDDEAPAAIASGSAPFTGSFRPEAPLSAFKGKSSLGTWTLRIVDIGPADIGTLNSWSLILNGGEASAVTSASGLFELANIPSGQARLVALPPSGWSVLAPANGAHSFTLSSSSSQSGLNFALRAPITLDTIAVRSLTFDGSNAQLEFHALPFQVHRIQGTDNLEGPWIDLGTFTPGLDGAYQWKDPQPFPETQYFYRAVTP